MPLSGEFLFAGILLAVLAAATAASALGDALGRVILEPIRYRMAGRDVHNDPKYHARLNRS